jgi:hypothetical protein
MHGIAPLRAIQKRTASAVLFFLAFSLWLAGGGRVSAQEAIYRCGHEYTNAPRDVSRCERLPAQSVTVIPGVRPHAVMPQGEPPRLVRSQPAPQPSARTVLAQELARLQKQHQAWAREVEMLLSQTGTAEYGAAPQNQDGVAVLQGAMARAERDISALERELARTPHVATPAAPKGAPPAESAADPFTVPAAARFIQP